MATVGGDATFPVSGGGGTIRPERGSIALRVCAGLEFSRSNAPRSDNRKLCCYSLMGIKNSRAAGNGGGKTITRRPSAGNAMVVRP
jgi:hypothetical protein